MEHFNDYQRFTDITANYPIESALGYTACGLVGEVGEYAEKISKVINLNGKASTSQFSQESVDALLELKEILDTAAEVSKRAEKLKKDIRSRKVTLPPIVIWSREEVEELVSEVGDIQWYIAQAAKALKTKLCDVVTRNVDKLVSRMRRNVIFGNGDRR
jgi:NTP pyrophosphatase (non-canonical NTP hydrolase)